MTFNVISQGNTYSLDDGTYCTLYAVDGLGMPPLDRFSLRGPQQHGETDKGYLLGARMIRLGVQIHPSNFQDYFTKRNFLIALFSPENDPIFEIVQPNASRRRINCVYDSDLVMPMSDQEWASQKMVLTLKAPNPALFDPDTNGTLGFSMGGGEGDEGEIPLAIPMEVGASEIDTTTIINYAGTWREYPIIRFFGPVTDPTIYNTTTGEKLSFDGYSIGADDVIEIDTAYGVKTAVLNDITNIIDKLTGDSDLASFHLEPRRVNESVRVNSIRVTGNGVNSQTRVEIAYLERYLGV